MSEVNSEVWHTREGNRDSYSALIAARLRFSLYLESPVIYSSPVSFQGLSFFPPKTPTYVRWLVVYIAVCFSSR